MARLEEATMPNSKFKHEVAKKLLVLGFLKAVKVEGRKMHLEFRYIDGVPALTDVKLFSKPGQRYYINYKDLKPVLGGMGYAILTTSKGIMTNSEARKAKVGGELLFNLW